MIWLWVAAGVLLGLWWRKPCRFRHAADRMYARYPDGRPAWRCPRCFKLEPRTDGTFRPEDVHRRAAFWAGVDEEAHRKTRPRSKSAERTKLRAVSGL